MEGPTIVPNSDLPDWAKPKERTDQQHSNVKADLVGSIKKYAFIICTALIIFASLRNSLTWYFTRFWGASATLWEDMWNYIFVDIFHENKFMIAVVGSTVVAAGQFWFVAFFYLLLDVFQPKWAMKYKIQEDKLPEMSKLWKAAKVVIRNQIIGVPCAIVPMYYISIWRGMAFTASELPSFYRVMWEGIVFTLVEEVGFYYVHRLFHHPRFYKKYHKIHHEWTASVSIVGIYSHPLEHLLSNLFPVFMGPIIMNSHLAIVWIWFMVAQASTLNSHCGYHLPFLPSPEAHDYHHLKFTNCFGVLGVLDRLHGTDTNFQNTKAYDRHILMIGLKPVKEVFPDEDKKCTPSSPKKTE